MTTGDPSKELRLLLSFFGESRIPHCRELSAASIPEPFRHLLVHDSHMTVTLEDHFGCPVVVRPYQVHRVGDVYGRKLDLLTERDGQVVMTGAMLFNLSLVTSKVAEAILAESAPLGRILIANDILRRVSSETYVEIEARDPLAARFGLNPPRAAFGRLATIFCDEKPAVDLLEIVTPEA